MCRFRYRTESLPSEGDERLRKQPRRLYDPKTSLPQWKAGLLRASIGSDLLFAQVVALARLGAVIAYGAGGGGGRVGPVTGDAGAGGAGEGGAGTVAGVEDDG